jgi:molybdopterin converting factor small subunit
MVTVALYGPVRDAAGQKTFTVAGETVGAVLEALSAEAPAVGERILEGGEIRGQVQVFVDGKKAGPLGGLDAPLEGGETVQLTEAMSGG